MILIYSNKTTNRLKYLCNFLFKEQLGLDFTLTDDTEIASKFNGAIINYSINKLHDCARSFKIIPRGLLFETTIKEQEIICKSSGNHLYFFETANSDYHFDILSAVFYLISRYEEYLPHKKDLYGRYPHSSSIAYREGFLKEPLVNKWIIEMGENLITYFPDLKITHTQFKFLPTYDIDIAYAFKGKGLIRNLTGYILSPSRDRISVLLGNQKDPFDTYADLDKLHLAKGLQPVYFFLVAGKRGRYDKNIKRESIALKTLIKNVSNKYQIGLHPSWISNDRKELLLNEKEYLEKNNPQKITRARQHYIKFNLPGTYRDLIAIGIKEEFSMGYGTVNGFRASAASSFYWYDLEKETETSLRIHPYCFMEANCYYEQKQSATQASDEIRYYYQQCLHVNGTLITIFHNNFIGNLKEFSGWGEMYKTFIEQLSYPSAPEA